MFLRYLRAMIVLSVLCGAVSSASQLSSKPATSCSTKANAVLQFTDDGTDPNLFRNYQSAIRPLLINEKFDDLDCIAGAIRSQKARFKGGMWKLHAFYEDIEAPPLHATEEDWQDQLAHLQHWVSARPDSITARVALASAYIDYGWSARGSGYADTVSESGWRLFHERAQKAKDILEDASKLRDKCPEWFATMAAVAQAQSWTVPQAYELFQRALAFEPTYYYYYYSYANFISPKWSGDEGDSERFTKESADRVGGVQGDILYFQIASSLFCGCGAEEATMKRLSWPRIQRGYSSLEKTFGASIHNENRLAYMAVEANDALLADELFHRIGDKWTAEVWRRTTFDGSREWAANMLPAVRLQQERDRQATENARSTEGAAYGKEVSSKLMAVLNTCPDAAQDNAIAFVLEMELQKDGSVGGMTSSNESPAIMCFFRKDAEWASAKASPFPPAPKPSYWLAFTVTPGLNGGQITLAVPGQNALENPQP